MPKHETIQNTIIPQKIDPPIPTRMVSTGYKKPLEIAGQPITNNSPVAESTTPVESVRLSAQVSAIARKEQAFRQRELALKEREKAMESRLAGGDKYETLKEKLNAKDYAEAEALGLNYEDYVKYVLEKQGGEDPVQNELKALRAELETFKKGTEESATQAYEETVSEYKKEIARMVLDNPEFSSIKELKREDAVLQVILDTFEEDGEELTISEAAKLVEEQLVTYGKAFIALPKFKKEEGTVDQQRTLPRPIVGKTLTNDMTVNSEKKPFKSLQYLSEAERYAEARRRVLERREKGN